MFSGNTFDKHNAEARFLSICFPQQSDPPVGQWLPWAWCNLRRNPFGELTRQERIELAVVDVGSIIDRVKTPRSAVQLIGDCGRGKTTRMLACGHRLAEAAYVYLPEDQPCPAIPEGAMLDY